MKRLTNGKRAYKRNLSSTVIHGLEVKQTVFLKNKMPPLKKPKLQKQLTSLWGLGASSDSTETTQAVLNVITNDGNSKSSEVGGLKRKFNRKWLSTYTWLRHEVSEHGEFMYCQLCTENNKSNAMHKESKNHNFQNSTLTRHVAHSDHKFCIEVPIQRMNMDRINKKMSSEEDKALMSLLKIVHWICTENIPIVKYKSMVDLMHEMLVPDLAILHKLPFQYDSEYTASELVDSLAFVSVEDVNKRLQNSPFVTILTDESTDICNHKRLVIYAQILDDSTMKPITVYVSNVECKDTSGKGIAKVIMEEMNNRGVSAQKLMSLGSDGASVMTGKHNGVAAIMKRENPHMVNVHCVAHRLALCTSQAAADIPHLQKHQQILTDLFYYFKGSSKRESRLQEIQRILDGPKLTVKELHSVRWLSYFNALTTIYRMLDSLFTYFADCNLSDAKAMGLKKKMSTDTFMSITYMMMDAMAPVTVLSQFFQTENVDVALVKVKIDLCLTDLTEVKSLKSPYLLQLKDDLQGDKFHGHHISESNFNLQVLTEKFVDGLVTNITSRFPDTDIIRSMHVLGMRPLTFLSQPELEAYGNPEIDELLKFFGQPQTVQWRDQGETKTTSSPAVVDAEAARKEWSQLKQVVKAEGYPRDKMWQLWQCIHSYHPEFPNMSKLAKLALTSAVHTAGCERGFSIQNQILSKSRNRLGISKQNQLMSIKTSSLCKSDLVEVALHHLKQAKNRRIFSLKH